jgi:hypothetical protein
VLSIAPNLADRAFLLRPTILLSNPPLCTLHELRTVYTIDDLADFHEALDLREADLNYWRQKRANGQDKLPKGRRR